MKTEQDAGPKASTFAWIPGKEHVKTFWLKDAGEPDRTMELLCDFGINLPFMGDWIAPAGEKEDGASIPRVLWSIAGAPFVGDYRRATVLHDVYCSHNGQVNNGEKRRSSFAVHLMFYYVMRADGVHWRRAFGMYVAVATFGPKWDQNGNLLPQKRPMTQADKNDIDRRLSDLFWKGVPADEQEALDRLHTEFGITE